MELFSYLLGLFLGAILGFFIAVHTYQGDGSYEQGAIAAHKGDIVCINIPFKEDRWECGEP